jgi:hypothetical protein
VILMIVYLSHETCLYHELFDLTQNIEFKYCRQITQIWNFKFDQSIMKNIKHKLQLIRPVLSNIRIILCFKVGGTKWYASVTTLPTYMFLYIFFGCKEIIKQKRVNELNYQRLEYMTSVLDSRHIWPDKFVLFWNSFLSKLNEILPDVLCNSHT